MTNAHELPQYGPGKFEGQPRCHRIVADCAQYGGDDDGSVDGVTMLRGGLSENEPGSFNAEGLRMAGMNDLTADERAYLASASGWIIDERDEQGFVTVERFETSDDLEAAWACEVAADAERSNLIDAE